MILMKELLRSSLTSLPVDHQVNLYHLHYRLNLIRRRYNRPMTVSSGYRTKEDHFRIYNSMGIANPPMGSQHLIGAAADINDPIGDLKKWIGENMSAIDEANLFMEAFDATGGLHTGWVHFQLFPPVSGNRFFKP